MTYNRHTQEARKQARAEWNAERRRLRSHYDRPSDPEDDLFAGPILCWSIAAGVAFIATLLAGLRLAMELAS